MFLEDFSPFFADFAEEVTINGVTVKGIFDKATVVDEVNAPVPSLMVKTGDIQGLKYLHPVTVRGQSFTVARVDDDGTGISVVVLNGTANR